MRVVRRPHLTRAVPEGDSGGGEESSRAAFLSELKEVRDRKRSIAQEAIRLKMTGKFSAEDEQLLREALGDSYADLIPPNRVLRMMAEAGVSPFSEGDSGEAARPTQDSGLEDLTPDEIGTMKIRVEKWRANLDRGSNEGLSIKELLQKGAGSGVNYAGDVGDVVFVSADDIGSRQMDGRQIYVVEEDAEDGEEATVQTDESRAERDELVQSEQTEQDGFEQWEDDVDIVVGEGVEDALREIEAGKRITLEPREGDLPQQTAEEYLEGMQMWQDRYEDQYRPRHERKLSPEKTKELDDEFNAYMKEHGLSEQPGTTPTPVDLSWDKKQRRLAPDVPPEADDMIQLFTRLQFLLRRAYFRREPLAVVDTLQKAGLLHPDCTYGDPFMVLQGADRWRETRTALQLAGAYSQPASLFGTQTGDRPPVYYVIVDSFLNLRVPEELRAGEPRIIWFDAERTIGDEDVIFTERDMLAVFNDWRDDGIACDWETDRGICTVCVTSKYSLGGESKQVEAVDVCWGLVAGSLLDAESFLALYSESVGGVTEEELWDGEVEYLNGKQPPGTSDE